jgi:ubiquitin-protein ligase
VAVHSIDTIGAGPSESGGVPAAAWDVAVRWIIQCALIGSDPRFVRLLRLIISSSALRGTILQYLSTAVYPELATSERDEFFYEGEGADDESDDDDDDEGVSEESLIASVLTAHEPLLRAVARVLGILPPSADCFRVATSILTCALADNDEHGYTVSPSTEVLARWVDVVAVHVDAMPVQDGVASDALIGPLVRRMDTEECMFTLLESLTSRRLLDRELVEVRVSQQWMMLVDELAQAQGVTQQRRTFDRLVWWAQRAHVIGGMSEDSLRGCLGAAKALPEPLNALATVAFFAPLQNEALSSIAVSATIPILGRLHDSDSVWADLAATCAHWAGRLMVGRPEVLAGLIGGHDTTPAIIIAVLRGSLEYMRETSAASEVPNDSRILTSEMRTRLQRVLEDRVTVLGGGSAWSNAKPYRVSPLRDFQARWRRVSSAGTDGRSAVQFKLNQLLESSKSLGTAATLVVIGTNQSRVIVALAGAGVEGDSAARTRAASKGSTSKEERSVGSRTALALSSVPVVYGNSVVVLGPSSSTVLFGALDDVSVIAKVSRSGGRPTLSVGKNGAKAKSRRLQTLNDLGLPESMLMSGNWMNSGPGPIPTIGFPWEKEGNSTSTSSSLGLSKWTTGNSASQSLHRAILSDGDPDVSLLVQAPPVDSLLRVGVMRLAAGEEEDLGAIDVFQLTSMELYALETQPADVASHLDSENPSDAVWVWTQLRVPLLALLEERSRGGSCKVWPPLRLCFVAGPRVLAVAATSSLWHRCLDAALSNATQVPGFGEAELVTSLTHLVLDALCCVADQGDEGTLHDQDVSVILAGIGELVREEKAPTGNDGIAGSHSRRRGGGTGSGKETAVWAKGTGFTSGMVGEDGESKALRDDMSSMDGMSLESRGLELAFNATAALISVSAGGEADASLAEALERSGLLQRAVSFLATDSLLDAFEHVDAVNGALSLVTSLLRSGVRLLEEPLLTLRVEELMRPLLTQTVAQAHLASLNDSTSDDEFFAFVNTIAETGGALTALRERRAEEAEVLESLADGPVEETTTGDEPANDYMSALADVEPFDVVDGIASESVLQSTATSDGLTGKASPDKMRWISSELASLSTSLPRTPHSMCLVRADEEALDNMRLLITGPVGTPYANGVFDFDVYCPVQFPNVPPKVRLRTTDAGRVRFNPNLYANGLVCLSLINTWQGATEEQWIPHSSTLLQVIVSIQSLIMVDQPYFNEPGYERRTGAHVERESAKYTSTIRAATVRVAMVQQIQEARRGEGIFAEAIRAHFLAKRDEVRRQAREWRVDAAPFPASHAALVKAEKELTEELIALCGDEHELAPLVWEPTRSMTSQHPHPVEQVERSNMWVCDGCEGHLGDGRHRCVEGCDFDLCGGCVTKFSVTSTGEEDDVTEADLKESK